MRVRPFYFLKESLINFRKNWVMSIAAISTVAASLLLFGAFTLFAYTMGNIIETIEQRVEIVVYLKDEAPHEVVSELQKEIIGWSEVKEINYVSKEEALERLKREFKEHPEMIQYIRGNPLPASLEIKLEDPHEVSQVANRLKGRPEIDDIKYGKKWVEKLFAVTKVVRWISVLFISLLAFASLVLISNTIRMGIYARRKEVAIMRLVGASNWFIRWPFLLEGIIQGILGAALAISLLYVGKTLLINKAEEVMPFLQIRLDEQFFIQILMALVVSGIIIGATGSFIALRRYLKV
jgi:cell division transport system permease protein